MKNKKKKTILVTGAGGVVGSYIPSIFTARKYNVILAGKKLIDVTNASQVGRTIKKHKPDLVVHLAASTNVDECEKHPKKTFKVNFEGTKNVANACRKIGAILIYVSTSAVFDGEKKVFSENDIPNPVNVYGKSKLEGEIYITNALSNYYIVRAGWMIGGGKKDKKFVSYIIEQAKNNTPMKVVNDKFGTITYAHELIAFLRDLFEKKRQYGIYHYGSKGVCSRYDMAKTILKTIQKKLPVTPVSSKTFASTFFAPRPHHEVITSVKHKFPNTWRQSLRSYITNITNEII